MAKILVIEDDQAVAEAIAFVLVRNGHQLDHAVNTQTAKQFLSAGKYDCALVDVWLDKEDGLDFLAAQRTAGNNLPFIVISGGGPGRSLENVTARADAHGAIGILYKPFEDRELVDALSLAFGNR